MSLLPDELKIQMFPCPNCAHYINDEMDVCKFCSTPITDEMKAAAILMERAERKKGFVGAEKQVMVTGIVIAGIGLMNTIFPTFDFYLHYSWGLRIPCLSSIAIVFGAGALLHGLRGYLRESKR